LALRGARVNVAVQDVRAKLALRLRALGRFVASPLLLPWLLVATLAAAVGGSLVPTQIAASASRSPHRAAVRLFPFPHVSRSQSAVGSSETATRALPHSRFASLGLAPFAAAPPKHQKPDAAALRGDSAGVPVVAIAAYEHAQSVLLQTKASCHLSWADVAGIGRVESDNGQTWGAAARVTSNGTLFPPIFGIPLDGLNGTPAMAGPGGGWVRAEGPMQFLPATWMEYAQDGNGDGQRNPQNFYDAALTTGVFLCDNGGNLSVAADLAAGILAYNHSAAYVALVKSWIAFYNQVGVTALEAAGGGLLPVGSPSTKVPTKPRTVVTPVVSPATLLSTAALSSEAAGTYRFGINALAGTSELAFGSGALDTHDGVGSLILQLPGSGALKIRLIGGKTYVSLPPALASAAGATGPWIAPTPLALSRLPAPIAAGLTLASSDLTWLVAQLAGAVGVAVVGHARIYGAAATEYAGETSFALAASHIPSSSFDLGRVAAVLGSSHLGVTAWVSDGRIRSAVVSLGSFAGVRQLSLHLSFTHYGGPVTVATPPLSPISAPTTTTTTTSTTTTTTTTLPKRAHGGT
jgi:membrane-bound lytic murein transglycosylase B